jgi:hypothetical protein
VYHIARLFVETPDELRKFLQVLQMSGYLQQGEEKEFKPETFLANM